MASKSFSIKRKAVPTFFQPDSDSVAPPAKPSHHSVLHHTINLPALRHQSHITSSPKKKNPLSSIRKMLSLTRLNTSFSPSKESSVPSYQFQHSNSGAQWLPLSPLSPKSTDDSAFSYPPSVLSESSNLTSTSTSPTSSSFSESSRSLSASYDPDDRSCHQGPHIFPNREAPFFHTSPELDLATPVSQKSLLTSWYDDWFETQIPAVETRPSPPRQGFLRETEDSEPRSFFEDDSDDDDYPISDSASEYSYSSIVPDCRDSDSEDSDDDGNEEDVTLTIGRRVICRRASYHVVSARSSEDSIHSVRQSEDATHSSQSSTPKARRAFELKRPQRPQ